MTGYVPSGSPTCQKSSQPTSPLCQEAQKLYVSHESLVIGLCIRILHKYCWIQAILAYDSRLQRWFPRTCSRQVPIKHTTISISMSLLKIAFSVYFFSNPKKKPDSTPSTWPNACHTPRGHGHGTIQDLQSGLRYP